MQLVLNPPETAILQTGREVMAVMGTVVFVRSVELLSCMPHKAYNSHSHHQGPSWLENRENTDVFFNIKLWVKSMTVSNLKSFMHPKFCP